MPIDKGKAQICQGKVTFCMLAGVGLDCARSVRDGHNYRHRMPHEKGLRERRKHPMNFVSCAHVYLPCSVISKITTYFVSVHYHRGLLNSYCKSRNLSSSENAGFLIILPFLMSHSLLFAINDIHITVIIRDKYYAD